MTNSTFALPSGATRRVFLAGLGAGAITGLPLAGARALTIITGTVVGKNGWLFLV
jgi:hypothetical protein